LEETAMATEQKIIRAQCVWMRGAREPYLF
jgi:hypothetical protein